MTTIIRANGSKWAGDEPDSVEVFLEKLGKHTLDPRFEAHGGFIELDPVNGRGDPLFAAGTSHFWGNFWDMSSVFDIASDEPELVAKITAAIRSNQASPAYAKAKAECGAPRPKLNPIAMIRNPRLPR